MSKVTILSRPNRITIASKGVQGARGPEGPQGPRGIQGEKGDTGDVTPEAIAARDAAVDAADSASQSANAAAASESEASASALAADGAAEARVQALRSDLADPTGGAALVAFPGGRTLADLATEFGGEMVRTKAPGTGAVELTLAQESRMRTSIEQYGGGTDKTAAQNGEAFNRAMGFLSTFGGGAIELQSGAEYRVQGITPRHYITIKGNGATLKAPDSSTAPIINYNSNNTLTEFNIYDLTLDGNGQAQNIVNITQPSPSAPSKTWFNSTLFNCIIKNTTAIGIYCPIPGRVRIQNSYIRDCDIGIAWDREHMDLYGTQVEYCRVGIRSTGNHFVAFHTSVAHNTEAGFSTAGAGLGVYTSVYEAGFIGCTFIDNPIHIQGDFLSCRFVGNRHSGGAGGQRCFDGGMSQCVVSGNTFQNFQNGAIVGVRAQNVITGNRFHGSATAPSPGIKTTSTGTTNIFDNVISDNYFMLCSEAIHLSGEGASRTCAYNSIRDNHIVQCGAGITVADSRAGNVICGNDMNTLGRSVSGGGYGISVTGVGGNINHMTVSGNDISVAHMEAIKVAHAGTIFGLHVDGNRIFEANLSGAASVSAIDLQCGVTASAFINNVVRNSATSSAQHAINLAGTAGDTLLSNNVARGMAGSSAYLMPASGVTSGVNVGSVGA